jgi:hypothetical protein
MLKSRSYAGKRDVLPTMPLSEAAITYVLAHTDERQRACLPMRAPS